MILLLSLSGSTTNPMAPGFPFPIVNSRGLLLATMKLVHSSKVMSNDGNSVINPYAQSSRPIQSVAATQF